MLAANFLQTILNAACLEGDLSLPIPLTNDQDFPVLQYADDTLIFMQGDIDQLIFLKELLNKFGESTGLNVNYDKSFMVPINVQDQKFNELADAFGCSKGTLPFTYLGLSLSISRPSVADFWPLVIKCERRLVSVSSFLSEAGRLQLTNAVFTALPTFAICTFRLPKTIIKQIDKFRKHCLWRGSDANSRKPFKAAWPLVCISMEEGGLGVLNLDTHNQCLLLKHLHKFYNRASVSWVDLIWEKYYSNGKLPVPGANFRGSSFWWRDIMKLLDTFKGIAMVNILDGSTCFSLYIYHVIICNPVK